MENISAIIQEIIRVDRVVSQKNRCVEEEAEKLLSDKTEELKKRKKEVIQSEKDLNKEAYLRAMDDAKNNSRELLLKQKEENEAIRGKYDRFKRDFAHQVITEILQNESVDD